MKRRTGGLRGIGVALILLWSLVPIYWAIKTSLQTEADARSRPAALPADERDLAELQRAARW